MAQREKRSSEHREHDQEELAQLAIAAQHGDKNAYNKLASILRPTLLKRAHQLVKRRDVAEDLVQDVLLDTWKSIDRATPTKITQYMQTALKNKVISYKRKHATWREIQHKTKADSDQTEWWDSVGGQKPQAEESIPIRELVTLIDGVLHKINPDQARAFKLFYEEGMSLKEIMEKEQIGANTLKSRLRYAREAIQKALDEQKKEVA